MSDKTVATQTVANQSVKSVLRDMIGNVSCTFEVGEILATAKANEKGQNFNMVKFVGYNAEDKNSAAARSELGESGRGQGNNVGQFVLPKIFGGSLNANGNRVNWFLTVKSMATKESDGGYGFRTMTVSELGQPSRLERLEVAEYFGKFFEVDLADLPTFPVTTLKEALANDLVSLQKRVSIYKEMSKTASEIKKLLDKDETIQDEKGNLVHFIPPNPTTEKIVVAETGEDIPKETNKVLRVALINQKVQEAFETNMVGLAEAYPNHTEYVPPIIQKNGKVKSTTNKWVFKMDKQLLPFYMIELGKIKEGYEKAARKVLPYAFGELERKMNRSEFPEQIKLGGKTFEVKKHFSSVSVPLGDTAERLADGTYTKRVSPSKGHGNWELIPAK